MFSKKIFIKNFVINYFHHHLPPVPRPCMQGVRQPYFWLLHLAAEFFRIPMFFHPFFLSSNFIKLSNYKNEKKNSHHYLAAKMTSYHSTQRTLHAHNMKVGVINSTCQRKRPNWTNWGLKNTTFSHKASPLCIFVLYRSNKSLYKCFIPP